MSSLYGAARQLLLTASFNWTALNIHATLMGASYNPAFDSDATLADVESSAMLTATLPVPALQAAFGYAKGGNVDYGTLTLATPVIGILLTSQPGSMRANTDPLIAYVNQGVGFGETPLGVDTRIAWDIAGIFRP